jgi:hypothetical protein
VTPRQEAAAAAREQGRQVSTYSVGERGLVRNGRQLKSGARIRLSQADAEILLGLGRIKRAGGKPSNPADPGAGS